VVVLGGQSLADAAAPSVPNGAQTGQAVGRAGFAYLTGLRQFAAALLWNRLDPQMHEYYGGHIGLGHMTFMLPNVKVITLLDPQFIEGYYVAPVILIESGTLPGTSPQEAKTRLESGLALAKEGVTNNPNSGILLESYAQLLWTEGKDLKAAVPYAERAMGKGIVWRTDEEQWDALSVLRDLFKKAGLTRDATTAQAIMDAIQNDPNATKNAADSDK
jgi:hypothetical protein